MSEYCKCKYCPDGFYNTEYSNNLNCSSCTTYCTPFPVDVCENYKLPVCANDNGWGCLHNTNYKFTAKLVLIT